ncbi:MAG: hypothetical protein KKC66_03535 [Candidatus Omnitrophica bacterium]|nr:hypothetical protein [Candidatus Omnitrophota bacterium]
MKIDLRKKIPEKFFNVIKLVGKTAEEYKSLAYMVGGPVRDILLSAGNHDLDFVIEGDAIKFAEDLNKRLKGDLRTHSAFGTATVTFKDMKVDIVTARQETYKRPAAYPDVEPATIKEDLFRRDFTINAMAVSVNKKDFGRLVDFYGGLGDLRKKLIRVMHDRSFIDDPTRIFRAVRFSVRFGFKIEPRTRRLMKEAIMDGLLGELNRGRVRKEIGLLLKEKKPLKCLQAFSRLV